MPTWEDMSRDCRNAARKLLDEDHLRSSISRSYYAAYCAVTSMLMARHMRFPYSWHNPAHNQLPDLILHNTTLPFRVRYEINKALRRLRKLREDADYRPGASLERVDAIHALRDATFILRIVEVQRDG